MCELPLFLSSAFIVIRRVCILNDLIFTWCLFGIHFDVDTFTMSFELYTLQGIKPSLSYFKCLNDM